MNTQVLSFDCLDTIKLSKSIFFSSRPIEWNDLANPKPDHSPPLKIDITLCMSLKIHGLCTQSTNDYFTSMLTTFFIFIQRMQVVLKRAKLTNFHMLQITRESNFIRVFEDHGVKLMNFDSRLVTIWTKLLTSNKISPFDNFTNGKPSKVTFVYRTLNCVLTNPQKKKWTGRVKSETGGSNSSQNRLTIFWSAVQGNNSPPANVYPKIPCPLLWIWEVVVGS